MGPNPGFERAWRPRRVAGGRRESVCPSPRAPSSGQGASRDLTAPAFLGLLVLLVAATLRPGPAAGQEDRAGGSVSGYVEPALKLTRMGGQAQLMAGGLVGLRLGSHLGIGGEGFAALGIVEISGRGYGSARELGMGYGGVTLEYLARPQQRLRWGGRLLLGIGSARAHDAALGIELGSDNFAVAEPQGSVRVRLLPWLGVGVQVGFRLITGLQDLPGIIPDDVKGYTVAVSLRIP